MFYEVAISSQPWPGVDAIKAGQASMPVWGTAQPCTPVQFSFVHGYFFKEHRLVWTQRLSPRPPQAPEWWDFSRFPGCISFPLLSVSWTCLLSSLNLCCSLSCFLSPLPLFFQCSYPDWALLCLSPSITGTSHLTVCQLSLFLSSPNVVGVQEVTVCSWSVCIFLVVSSISCGVCPGV